ncbi:MULTISPECIES: phosphoribosylformylglycinamidine synthase subunit PurS [unclassified Acidiphilium]|uniref:phosphoribosylformylglycinamidine synthase subunit PurS n=1 Tax=unclassified Acidiphilium TaxID=2617493 RepID=UPI000BCEC9EF|nr:MULTISPECIES: phosphoribosylformylglycinamidine synthase subunit PurS [unclassified Acidiphilium]OYV55254.1 MAG: phosphoribosylformylglycinamidine synthase [Acidiphilium sp. 20-67-58]HQT61753.1 phosphoribosylformylglycinamidine synthase subunit PurS [Acidiphilium sp.]
MKVVVAVKLKPGVLDPQGKAIGHALEGLGYDGVTDVRVGKLIELDIAETDREKARSTAEAMARRLLANTVVENFEISLP